MKRLKRMLICSGIGLGACLLSVPAQASAQSKDSTVGQTVTHGAKTLKHNVIKTSRRLAHKTKRAANKTSVAT
ncbi:MAG: hypothetical protein ABR582_11175, partial [Gemmatimonadaceae bacterium]